MYKVACLGDSLTAAYEIREDLCWSALCQDVLKLKFTNRGVSGDSTAGMLSRLPAILKEDKYSHIIVYGGTNDLYMSLTDQQIISNITAMTRQIKHAGMFPIVGLPAMLHLDTGMASIFLSNEALSNRMKNFRTQLKAQLELDQQLSFDFNTNITKAALMDDGVHYNAVGHQLISEALCNFLKQLLI